MARLNLVAIAEDSIASPGNALELYIMMSVTNNAGVAVSGLGMSNFNLGTEIVGPMGSISHISSVTNGSVAGIYSMQVLPLAGQTWKAGVYIFSITVTSGSNTGQTLCSVLMD